MGLSINNNLMARDVVRNLTCHYARLSSSTEALSTGLRVNSAADDAAGLAIRELMRADVRTLGQGTRNANDAVSLIQTADGALAIIDEKLIRMKELAEQAATGTYDSIQRMIIESEYQQMASEIDRIANSTTFNGVKLLDGSLSGTHDGSGLAPTGALKVHFGTANDSAEDYYYIAIGDCTIAALGLGNGQAGDTTVTREVDTYSETEYSFHPKNSYIEYTDPDTGKAYYSDGNFFFSNTSNPVASRLDWETDGSLIKKLKMVQKTTTSAITYQTYLDPDTGSEYYLRAGSYTSDPYNPQGTLDANNAADKAIIDRLQKTNKALRVDIVWQVYSDPNGTSYYSYNNGQTFVPDVSEPSTGVLDVKNNADKAIINTLTPSMSEKKVTYTTVTRYYEFVDTQTSVKYWSSDGGITFVRSTGNPDGTRLDPIADKDIIARLQPSPQTYRLTTNYPKWVDKTTGDIYYTLDYGKTFFTSIQQPENIIFDSSNPAHAAAISNLEPDFKKKNGDVLCTVYEDQKNNNKKYYSVDNGKTFFDDLGDYAGSSIDASDPNYSALKANLKKVDSTVSLIVIYDTYKDSRNNNLYYSSDGGKTFVKNPDSPSTTTLDPNDSRDAQIIAALVPQCNETITFEDYFLYTDPTAKYYLTLDGNTFMDTTGTIVLDRKNPAHVQIIDTLQQAQRNVYTTITEKIPQVYYIFEDPRSGTIYYTSDDGQTFTSDPLHPSDKSKFLDPTDPDDLDVLNNLQAVMVKVRDGTQTITERVGAGGAGGSVTGISTQEAAQRALVALDRAIVSKDAIRAHLGALQNRLENTVTNLTIQAENLQSAESRISDADVAQEMTQFVRNQVLTQSATAMLSQANSFPHLLLNLISG